jgi:hypothetical protein
MVAILLALALAPWAHPLSFRALPGWSTGASGNTHSLYTNGPFESAAWTARNVRYLDVATADPPNKTLARLPSNGIVVWAVIYVPVANGQRPITLDLRRARHLKCCDGPVRVAGGDYELTGYGPGRAYSIIIRVYFGSRPARARIAEAQHALNQLRLPTGR